MHMYALTYRMAICAGARREQPLNSICFLRSENIFNKWIYRNSNNSEYTIARQVSSIAPFVSGFCENVCFKIRHIILFCGLRGTPPHQFCPSSSPVEASSTSHALAHSTGHLAARHSSSYEHIIELPLLDNWPGVNLCQKVHFE